MLGLILLIFIAKPFYQMAEERKKNKWLFAFFGVAAYYSGSFMGGVVLVVVFNLFGWAAINEFSDIQIGLMALPFGLLSCYGLYKGLEKKWKKNTFESLEIIDDELL